MSNYTITPNQSSIMNVLVDAKSFHDTPLDEQVDIDELIEKVNYEVTKEAIQFTLRGLAKRNYIQKGSSLVYRRGKRRVVWALSKQGAVFMLRNRS